MRALPFSILSVLFLLDPVISLRELGRLNGNWKGTLTYLDYTRNQPYSMPVEIRVRKSKQLNGVILDYDFPNEKKANYTDTLLITSGGRVLNGEEVTLVEEKVQDFIQIRTEKEGRDGNDNKPARIRHEYVIGKKRIILRKQVLFQGSTEYILRNEYVLNPK